VILHDGTADETRQTCRRNSVGVALEFWPYGCDKGRETLPETLMDVNVGWWNTEHEL